MTPRPSDFNMNGMHGRLPRRTLVRNALVSGAASLLGTAPASHVEGTNAGTPRPPLTPEGTEVLWDTWGVPHIHAVDAPGLFFGFGWAQMHSHGNLLLRLYGEARGRAAEYWGEAYLELDRLLWTMGFPERAAEWYGAQSPAFRPNLDAFAAGVNAYAASYPDRLADDVKVVLPVTAEDVLAHTLRVWFVFLSGAGDRSGLLPSILAEGTGGTGSNAWAIAPSRTVNDNALLLSNPHLPWSHLYRFYEAQLTAPGVYDAYGTMLVGLPVLMLAFNDTLGWTHTVNTLDPWDAYELTPVDDGYAYDGQIQPFETTTTRLKVRQFDGSLREEPLIVRRAVHGPVIAEREGRPIALRVVGVDQAPAVGLLEQYWDMGRARDITEFEAALRRQQLPMFTVVYADRDGHVMYLFNGQIPVRAGGDWGFWSGIVPGDDPALVWSEILRYDDLPRLVDPASGWVQNANEPPWTATLPPPFARSHFPAYVAPPLAAEGPGFRAQRSMRMLVEDEQFDLPALVTAANDTRVELADRVLDDLVAAARKDRRPTVQEAGEVLAGWDRRTEPESRGAVLFLLWVSTATTNARPTGESFFAFPPGVLATRWDEGAPLSTPDGLADPVAALEALAAAADATRSTFGTLDVAWGNVVRLREGSVDLPAAGGPGDPLGVFRALYPTPDEDGRLRVVGGDTYIAAIEFADSVRARVILAYGNASQPGSPHVADQLPLFARKEMRQAWLTREEVEANLEAHDVLNNPTATPVAASREPSAARSW